MKLFTAMTLIGRETVEASLLSITSGDRTSYVCTRIVPQVSPKGPLFDYGVVERKGFFSEHVLKESDTEEDAILQLLAERGISEEDFERFCVTARSAHVIQDAFENVARNVYGSKPRVLEDAVNGLVRHLQNATTLLQYAQKEDESEI